MGISKRNAEGYVDYTPYHAVRNIERDEQQKAVRSKYGNVKTVVDGIRFDSKAEARRYEQLKLLERAGEISHLELQKTFKLHAGIRYRADFMYCELASNKVVAEDVKGYITKEFKLKQKLFNDLYPDVELRVVKAKEI